jgi:hypothetical protein
MKSDRIASGDRRCRKSRVGSAHEHRGVYHHVDATIMPGIRPKQTTTPEVYAASDRDVAGALDFAKDCDDAVPAVARW